MHDCVFLVTINNSVPGQFSIELWIKRSVHVNVGDPKQLQSLYKGGRLEHQ